MAAFPLVCEASVKCLIDLGKNNTSKQLCNIALIDLFWFHGQINGKNNELICLQYKIFFFSPWPCSSRSE